MSQQWLPTGIVGKSRNLQAFRDRSRGMPQRFRGYRNVNDIDRPALLEFAGARSGTVRQAETQPEFEARMAAAQAIEGIEGEKEAPALLRFIDFLNRGSSAFVGAYTGLSGEDRVEGVKGQEADLIGPDEGRIGAAVRRFREGISGEDSFRAADFGAVAAAKAAGEDVGTLQRGWNAARGFIIDTALDPLTYISFGGSILGRRLGSEAVMGITQKAFRNGAKVIDHENMIRAGVASANVTRPELLAARLNNIVDQASATLKASDVASDKKLAAIIDSVSKKTRFKPTDDVETILSKIRRYNIRSSGDTKAFNLGQEYVLRDAPEYAAAYYARRGAGGLRLWAKQNMGDEAGEAYFRSLPRDIQGGIRIRAPFLRAKDGTPYAIGIPGIGAGRLSAKSKIAKNMWVKSENVRDYVRMRFGNWPAKYLSGDYGETFWFAMTAGIRQAKGSADRPRPATYADYAGLLRNTRRALIDERNMSRVVKEGHLEASDLYSTGLEKYGDKFVNKFRQFFYDKAKMDEELKRFQSATTQKAEPGTFMALNAAARWREMLDQLGQEIVEEFSGNADEITFFIKNYVPRVATENEMRRRARRFGPRALAGFPKYTKHRSAFASAWSIKQDGDAIILEWMPPEMINDLYAAFYGVDNIVRTDPREFMGIYLAEVRASLIDQRLLNNFRREGLLTRLGVDDVPMGLEISPTIVVQRAVEALGMNVDRTEPGIAPIVNFSDSWLTDLQQRLKQELGEAGTKPSARGRPMTISAADRMQRFLTTGGGTGRFRIDVPDRMDIDGYVPDQKVETVLRNRADGTTIEILTQKGNLIPTVQVKNAAGVVLKKLDGTPMEFSADMSVTRTGFTGTGQTTMFPKGHKAFGRTDIEQAVRKAEEYMSRAGLIDQASGRSFKQIRSDWYVNQMYQVLRKVQDEVEDFITNRPQDLLKLMGRDALSEIPPDQRDDYIRGLVNLVQRQLDFFGAADPVAKATKGGMAVIERQGTRRSFPRLPEKYEAFIERMQMVDPGLRNVQGELGVTGFAARVEPKRLKDSIARQMQTDFAPVAVMNAIRKNFIAYEKPTGVAKVLWEEVYQPFYAMQKVGMTLFRGFGFIGRNINGGMWNNFLNDVGRQDHSAAGRIVVMQAKARQKVKKDMGDAFQRNPETAANRVQEELEKMIRRSFTGKNNFLDNTSDADALIELHQLYYFQGLGSDRAMNRITGEVMQRARSLQRGARRVEVPTLDADGNMVVRNIPRNQLGPEGLMLSDEETAGAISKAVDWLAFDNPWIKHVMSPMSEASEDFLRLAAFLKGARETGLEPIESGIRGFAASLWVKATQFDYTDLSDFERNVLKNIVPFYTWTRYNVPLQLRALIAKPARILQATRIQESLADTFGDETAGPMPGYLKNLFGYEIPEDSFTWLPEFMRPQGNVGMGLVWGEPIVDLARWFRVPGGQSLSPINFQEAVMNLNPAFRVVGSSIAGLEGDPSISLQNQEEAPGWLALPIKGLRNFGLDNIPGVTEDMRTGEPQVSRYVTEIVRSVLPQISVLERNIPWVFGNERQRGRAFGAITSSMFGLPTSTLDDWIRASEQVRMSQFVKDQMDVMFGESSAYRMEIVRRLTEEGAPIDFISQLDLATMEDEQVDVGQAIGAWRVMKQILQLKGMGVPDEELAAALSGLVPEGTEADEWFNFLFEGLNISDSDKNKFIRQFDRRRLTEEDLARFGLTPADVRQMNNNELRVLLMLAGGDAPF